jgi:transposase-like protein
MADVVNTLQQAIQFFSNYENCHNFMVSLRWPDGKVTCPHCSSNKVTFLAKPRAWKCYSNHPKPRFTLKTGTVFEDSPLGLDKWLPVLWMVVNCKKGISSYQVHRDMGVTQKTAWFMLHRCRLAMQDITGGKLGGEVEVDETFIGGKARDMHKSVRARKVTGTGGKDKTMVMGILERGGEVRAMVVDNRRRKNSRSKYASM